MLGKIIKGYLGVLRAATGFLLLLAVCVCAGAFIVWPLWRLADTDPSLYTVIFTVLLAALVALLVFGRVRQSFLRDSRAFFLSLFRKLTVIAGIAVPVSLVLARARFAALIALILAFALYGFLAFGLSSTDRADRAPRGRKNPTSQ